MIGKLKEALLELKEKNNVFIDEFEQEKRDNVLKVEEYKAQLEREAQANYNTKVHDLEIEIACVNRLIERFETEAQQEAIAMAQQEQYYGNEV